MQADQVIWKKNERKKDQLVQELRDTLKKNQEQTSEELARIGSQVSRQEENITQFLRELEAEKEEKRILLETTGQVRLIQTCLNQIST